MAKDRKARADNRVTVMAIGNIVASLVDTMNAAEVPGFIVHDFLDRLEHLNAITLSGTASLVMIDLVEVVRRTVPAND